MKYTLQNDLDSLGLGGRWGCTWTGLALNVCEHARRRIATEVETSLLIGRCFRKKLALMCNYIDDADLKKDAKDVKDWDQENPEWHWYVLHRADLFHVATATLQAVVDPANYRVAIMLTQHKTYHYCILTASGELINPDPSLKGEIVETRALIY